MAKEKGQHTKRRNRTYIDDFGRKWFATIELASGDPAGAIEPVGWRDRLKLHQKYLTKALDKDDPTRLNIKKALLLLEKDLKAAHEEWHRKLRQNAIEQFGPAAAGAIENPPPILLHKTGPKPQPVELVQAALQGNKYVLGLSDKMPSWAEPFFAPPVQATGPSFPDADEEQYADAEDETEGEEFPIHRGGGVYELSTGDKIRAKREEAEKAERDLRQPAGAGAGSVDPSWKE